MTTPKAPAGLKQSGARLWNSIVEKAELDVHETLVLTEACRIADRLDLLDAAISKSKGLDKDLLVESRHQQITFTRVLASLRLPDSLTGKRPQRRGSARPPYHETAR